MFKIMVCIVVMISVFAYAGAHGQFSPLLWMASLAAIAAVLDYAMDLAEVGK